VEEVIPGDKEKGHARGCCGRKHRTTNDGQLDVWRQFLVEVDPQVFQYPTISGSLACARSIGRHDAKIVCLPELLSPPRWIVKQRSGGPATSRGRFVDGDTSDR